MVQNALFHHKAWGLCHNFGNCPCLIKWFSSLELGGLSAITKVYGYGLFQGFLKENNLGSGLNLDWHLEFMGFQTSFFTHQFPFLFIHP
jgi:hypothetical protein